MNEPELIKALQQGTAEAFERLVQTYKDKLYNTALGFVQNEYEAEEVTQEVFIKVFENIKYFKNESRLSTWLYRITVTHSLDAMRRRKRKKRMGVLLSIFGTSGNHWEQPDFYHPGIALEQKEDAAVIFKAVKQLPEQQQAAFLLQKLEGLSQQQLAEVLETTESAVESLLSRAKSNLKKLLGAYYQNHYK